MLDRKILIWDNDGTVTGSVNPHDTSSTAKRILPGVAETMAGANNNFIISGFRTPERELDFDPELIITKFKELMEKLPIDAAAFSPTRGGIACYVLVRNEDRTFSTIKAHEDKRYQHHIGSFKKPDIGMFEVIRDLATERFGLTIDGDTSVMIGDTWHDKQAATDFGIPFVHADEVHCN